VYVCVCTERTISAGTPPTDFGTAGARRGTGAASGTGAAFDATCAAFDPASGLGTAGMATGAGSAVPDGVIAVDGFGVTGLGAGDAGTRGELGELSGPCKQTERIELDALGVRTISRVNPSYRYR